MASNHTTNQFEDIKSDNNDERTPLLLNNIQKNNINTPTTDDGDDIIHVPSITSYRPTNILRFILFIEFLTILIIWFAGNLNILYYYFFQIFYNLNR